MNFLKNSLVYGLYEIKLLSTKYIKIEGTKIINRLNFIGQYNGLEVINLSINNFKKGFKLNYTLSKYFSSSKGPFLKYIHRLGGGGLSLLQNVHLSS